MGIAVIRYSVQSADLDRHRFIVECVLDDPDPAQQFMLPSWIPGSYMLREFARHVVAIAATSRGRAVDIEKVAKGTWLCRGADSELRVHMSVHAFDQSVRGAYVDRRRAFFNGACLFLLPAGREDEEVEVEIKSTADSSCANWRVATALAPVAIDARGFGTYRASDYDELLDQPVEISDFADASFVAGGVPHRFVLAGRAETDLERVATDLSQLCQTHIEFFGRPAPFASYTFLGLAVGEGYGGLEHRASSSLIFARDDLPKVGEPGVPRAYQRFLALASHEYFHAWHVKRTMPAAFMPYRLSQRQHTRLLWVFEGITTYYQDLLLRRSQLIGTKDYLRRVGESLTRVYRAPGRLQQSIAEASFDAWDKLYKPEADSPNSGISYYSKGALVALALDLSLRLEGRTTLDEVVRELWRRFGARGVGVVEDGFDGLVLELGGAGYAEFLERYVRGTGDLNLAETLAAFGLRLSFRAQQSATDAGGTAPAETPPPPDFGATSRARPEGLELMTVFDGGPAQKAGLCPGDVVIALGDLKVGESNLLKRLARYDPGEVVPVAAFRGDELLRVPLAVGAPPASTCYIEIVADAAQAAVERRRAWLAE